MSAKLKKAAPKIYDLMLAESRALGLPRSFSTDLTTHDRAFVESRDPVLPFVWCLYESGTHIIRPERDQACRDARVARPYEMARVMHDTFPDVRFYWCEGDRLEPIGMSALIERMIDLKDASGREVRS